MAANKGKVNTPMDEYFEGFSPQDIMKDGFLGRLKTIEDMIKMFEEKVLELEDEVVSVRESLLIYNKMSQRLANRAVSAKRKRSFLSIEQKLDMIEKHERGYSVTRLAAEFNVGKSTVCDIKRQKDDIRKFLTSSDSGALNKRKTKGSANTNLDEAVYKWFNQERSVGMPLGGDAIKTAADKFAQKMNIPDFRASEGWLQRFKNRHNIKNRKVCGESLSADTDSVEPFKRKLNDYIITNDLRRFQVYNADETGFNWKCLQNNTLASRLDESVPGRKVNKEKVSAMLCANADRSHRTKSAIVGK
ncbi:tigger transposable element-derived protein 7 [Procambarus clarkii]|uniref:tigger transposable element-derived protein 7 n=1 Tax=Procambarus clarkii TaxID=6728 RepID=UPI003743D94F